MVLAIWPPVLPHGGRAGAGGAGGYQRFHAQDGAANRHHGTLAISATQANAEALPFPDNYFDCITISFGLRNVTDKDKALRSMFRVLKPGGRLLVLEFSSRCWSR